MCFVFKSHATAMYVRSVPANLVQILPLRRKVLRAPLGELAAGHVEHIVRSGLSGQSAEGCI